MTEANAGKRSPLTALEGATWQEAVLAVLDRQQSAVGRLASAYRLDPEKREEVQAEANFRLCLEARDALAAGRHEVSIRRLAYRALYHCLFGKRSVSLEAVYAKWDRPYTEFVEDPRGTKEDTPARALVRRMAEMHAAGMTLAEVGQALGYTRAYVRKCLREAGRVVLGDNWAKSAGGSSKRSEDLPTDRPLYLSVLAGVLSASAAPAWLDEPAPAWVDEMDDEERERYEAQRRGDTLEGGRLRTRQRLGVG